MSETRTVDTKPAVTSVTIIGVVIFLLATLARRWGYHVDESLQSETADMIASIFQLVVGPLLAIVGRWRASKPLSVTGGRAERTVAPALLLSLLLATAGGCAPDKAREVYSGFNDAFIGIVTDLNESRHYFDDREWDEKIAPLIFKGNVALRSYDAATRKGLSGGDWRSQVIEAMNELEPYLTKAEARRGPSNGTDPQGTLDGVRRDRPPGAEREPDARGARGVYRAAQRRAGTGSSQGDGTPAARLAA